MIQQLTHTEAVSASTVFNAETRISFPKGSIAWRVRTVFNNGEHQTVELHNLLGGRQSRTKLISRADLIAQGAQVWVA